MARGSRILMASVEEDKKAPVAHTPRRNQCLVYRFYYYSYLQQHSYERCLELLSTEFFLSQSRIIQLLMAEQEQLQELKRSGAGLKELSAQFPHFMWK